MSDSSRIALVPADGRKDNLAQLILASCGANPDKVAFQHRIGKEWHTLTYGEWETRAATLAAWMIGKGIRKGDHVAILCYNHPQWPTVDLAAQMLGAVVVPVYPSLTGPQHNYILHDAEIKIFFVMDAVHLEPVRKLAGALDHVTVVGMLNPDHWPVPSKEKLREAKLTAPPKSWPEDVVSLETILAGSAPTSAQVEELRQRIDSIGGDDLATVCYTSGTTSTPPAVSGTEVVMVYAGKGVMLTHTNLVSNVKGIIESVSIGHDDSFLSVLPLAHMFERTCGYYCSASQGATVSYATSPASLMDDMAEVKPTIFACVPLLFEKMYQRMSAYGDKPAIKKTLSGISKVAGLVADPKKVASYLDKKKAKVLGKLFKMKSGGKVRFAVSGGAALSKDLAEFFHRDAGVLILEGFGLSETSPVLTCNRPDRFRFGTVGVPIRDCEITIAEDGEVLARGPMIMKGYLKNPEETAKAIDERGYFHTGDIGSFDEDGFLKITGRKKTIFKLSTGKYVSPEPIENKMVNPLVSATMVCGENQKIAGALIFPNMPALHSQAAHLGVTGTDEEICAHETVRKIYEKLLAEACAHLPDFEKVKVFRVVPAALSIDSGELTPTLKVKRSVIGEKFKAELEGMFAPSGK